MDSAEIEKTLEEISAHGCAHVHSLLSRAQQGKDLLEIKHLSPEEQILVVTQLQEIMSVYQTNKTS